MWNNFVFPFFNADIGMGQDSTLFPILFALYITLIFHIFERISKSLLPLIPISTLSFVNNNLFISQEKSYKKLNANIFCSYNIISSIFNQFGLTIEQNKLEVFYFSRLTKNYHPPLLNLRLLEGSLLYLKDTWRYLGFFFDKKLLFQHHVHYYTNKALSTIKNIKMLGNSNRSLFSTYK